MDENVAQSRLCFTHQVLCSRFRKRPSRTISKQTQKKREGIILAICVAALLLFGDTSNVTPILAHSGDVLTAWATVTPTIDGVVSLGEWDDADSIGFLLEYSDLQPNASAHNATLYVKNDATYLYLATVVELEDYNPNDFGNWMFENDNDGTIQIGDDGLSIRSDGLSIDRYRTNPIEGWWSSDTIGGGTNDIVGAVNHTNPGGLGDYTFEYRHPLDSADNIHDFSLTPGDTVGFQFQFNDAGPGGGGDEWPGLPLYGDIVLAAPPTYTLSLRVRDEGNNPIEEASVILDGEFKGHTNIEGELAINNVTEGTHIILITKAGYVDKEVEVTLISNMTLSVTLSASVNQPPEAEIISVSPSPGEVGQPVTFTFSGYDPDGTAVNYEWLWGDGTLPVSGGLPGNDIPIDVDHVYAVEGDYTANLTVLDDDGAWSSPVSTTLRIEQMIEENQPPTAYVDSIEPSSAVVGDEVTFTGYGTDPDGEIVSYLWTSNIDGMLSSQDSFSTFDLSDGVHTISFQVQDDDGAWSDETTQSLVINPPEDYEPPLIDTPSLLPEAPSGGESVVIEVFVFDEANDVENVTLSYRVTDGTWETLPMELVEGIWTVTIPEQGGGTVVEFYIGSFDIAGNYAESEIFSYEVARQGIDLYTVMIAAVGVATASGAIITIAKTGAWRTSSRAITRFAKRVRGERLETKEREMKERRRKKKRKEKPKLVWTLVSPRKIRTGGHAYVQSEIKNIGKTPATGVEMRIKGPAELKLDSPLKIGVIKRNTSKRLRAKIECRKKVLEGKRSLMFKLISNEIPPQTSVRAISFESLSVGLLRDSHHTAYLQKHGKRQTSPGRLHAWLAERKFDYEVVNEAENLGALQMYDTIIAASQYALSDKDVASLRHYLQTGHGLVVLDGTGTINADAFLGGEPNYNGEKRVYDLYGYSRPDVANIEKGLKGIRIVENSHSVTRGYRRGEFLSLPTQTGIAFTQPVSKARTLADQRVSIEGRSGYIGISCLIVRQLGRGRVAHFNFDAESVVGMISPLVEKAILWSASFE